MLHVFLKLMRENLSSVNIMSHTLSKPPPGRKDCNKWSHSVVNDTTLC